MSENARIEAFWGWFRRVAGPLAADIESCSLLEELDARISELDSMLSWEVGPGSHEPYQFVISPNLDRRLLQKTREIISRAPVIEGWEFYFARRPKRWDYKLIIERSDRRGSIELDASGWYFVLLQYPDGAREVLLQAIVSRLWMTTSDGKSPQSHLKVFLVRRCFWIALMSLNLWITLNCSLQRSGSRFSAFVKQFWESKLRQMPNED
jgi:hypothetical protein